MYQVATQQSCYWTASWVAFLLILLLISFSNSSVPPTSVNSWKKITKMISTFANNLI
jgi:hypothetical protein